MPVWSPILQSQVDFLVGGRGGITCFCTDDEDASNSEADEDEVSSSEWSDEPIVDFTKTKPPRRRKSPRKAGKAPRSSSDTDDDVPLASLKRSKVGRPARKAFLLSEKIMASRHFQHGCRASTSSDYTRRDGTGVYACVVF